MKTKSNVEARLRRQHAVMMDRYFEDGWSVGAVADASHRSRAWVLKLIKKEGARPRRKRGGSPDPRRRENRRPKSSLHAQIGVAASLKRRRAGLSMTEFGLRVGLSRFRVGELEAGAYDLSLSDLMALAAELNVELTTLLGGRILQSKSRQNSTPYARAKRV